MSERLVLVWMVVVCLGGLGYMYVRFTSCRSEGFGTIYCLTH